jgi:hypothetical protein
VRVADRTSPFLPVHAPERRPARFELTQAHVARSLAQLCLCRHQLVLRDLSRPFSGQPNADPCFHESLRLFCQPWPARRFDGIPLFTRLLRPRVERYYEVRIGVPVGDLPREADLVLLRRTRSGPTPFEGIWRHLTAWNLLEFKGATEDARPAHLPLLIELGLGIARRLRTEGRSRSARQMPAAEISFWYLANRLGRSIAAEAQRVLSNLQATGPGLWWAIVLGHPVYLVSTVDLPVDDDTLPLHVLAQESPERERQVGEFVVASPERVETYGGMFSVLHEAAWKEVETMARRSRRDFERDIAAALIRQAGEEVVIRELDKKKIIRQIGAKHIVEALDPETIVANLPPAKRRELKRLLSKE